MEKIKLSMREKKILRLLKEGEYDKIDPNKNKEDFFHLRMLGLVTAIDIDQGGFIGPELTETGRMYFYENPNLNNPSFFDVKYLITMLLSILKLVK